jgi:diguanylate cyclase (GGDEF)-like protein/PAS domain S-box-containing protein
MLRLPLPFRAHQRLQRRLAYLVLLAALALIAADVISLRSARHDAMTAAWSESANLARSISDQLSATFQLTDAFVRGLRDQIEADGTEPAALSRVDRQLPAAQRTLFMLRGIAVLDAQGRVLIQHGAGMPADQANVASRVFRHHRDTADRASFLGWPTRDPTSGSWQITVSCRLENAAHHFAGIVVASLPIDYFESMFTGYDVGPDGLISMLREDGVHIARTPFAPQGVGGLADAFPRRAERGNLQLTSQIDGIVRLNSYVWLRGEPVFLLVGRTKSAVLAGWWTTVMTHSIALVLVLGTLGTLGWRLSRSIGESERSRSLLLHSNAQLAASEAQALRANQWLEMAEELAHVGHWHLSLADGHSLCWSDEVYRLHGVDKAHFLPTARDVIDIYHPEDRPRMRDAVAESIATGRPFELLARFLWPDGSVRHVLTRGCYLPDPPGAPPSVFGVIMDVTDQKMTEALLVDAKATAEAANTALEEANRALHALAMQDALTGLSNRRHFDRALDQEFRRSVRAGLSLGMILLDVDQFKQFNDLYGHQAGDACLQAIAHAIPPLLNRPGDIAARYGGEEIALLLPGTNLAGARGLGEQVALAVRKLGIPHAGSQHQVVTISAGVEAFVPLRDVNTAAQLVEHADLALYAAKRAGRDKVMNFQECAADTRLRAFQS